jgi:hypothetical protein
MKVPEFRFQNLDGLAAIRRHTTAPAAYSDCSQARQVCTPRGRE